MACIQAHAAGLMRMLIENDDLIPLLQQLDLLLPQYVGRRLQGALVGGIRKCLTTERHLAARFQDCR
jgi:hypothetical protein